jgi:hypothetical protein
VKILLLLLVSACSFAQQLPNSQLTPGIIRTSDAREICSPKFRTKPFRLTTAKMKKDVCAAYHVARCPRANVMELDHLVPLELGGADDERNLWPQMAPEFHWKDQLENYLRRQVCDGKMQLAEAQICLQADWFGCYQRLHLQHK